MKKRLGAKKKTFVIKIVDDQNESWQGYILWLEEQKKQHFRSALEMLNLIQTALEQKK